MNEFKPHIHKLIQYYREDLNNPTGGWLHIVLDDGNIDALWNCLQDAEKNGDTFAVFLVDVLMEFSEEELESMYENDWKKPC